MPASNRFLLLQVRNADDPMRGQEVRCFARALGCPESAIRVRDLIAGVPDRDEIDAVDAVLLGGSGDYSVAEGGAWLDDALASMRELHDWSKPTFASCWGFQAMARALGGVVVRDHARGELGTHPVLLTPAGAADPLFGSLAPEFLGQMGHEDVVDVMPERSTHLARTDRCASQAFTFWPERPIWCTQFHPEIERSDFIERIRRYPRYVEALTGLEFDDFLATLRESPAAAGILRRFGLGVARRFAGRWWES